MIGVTVGSNTIKLLLVDDHALVLDGLMARLELEPHLEIVGCANNGKDAIEQARVLNPDVVLMDVSMPIMSGLEAAKHFKEQLPHIKVLMLSMHDDREYILSLVQSGASGYVLKDVSARELVTAIDTVYQGGTYFSARASQALFMQNTGLDKDEERCELTSREKDVLRQLAAGMSNKEVANKLHISIRTVETHRQNIKTKLGINTTAGLIRYAIDIGLLN